MNFSAAAVKARTRERFAMLIAAGPGAYAYSLDAAEKLVAEDQTQHAGLVDEVKTQMGSDAAKKASQELKWFRSHP